MKRWAQGAAVCVLVLILAACSNKQEQSTTPAVSSSQKVNKDRLKLNWDDGKTANLNDYMAQFGVVMKQAYTRIGKSTSEDWFGTSLSDYIASKQKLVLDGQQRAVNWLPSPSRGSKSKLNVLAIYLDAKNNILYFFVNQNNTVRVYVSQERPDDNGLINIKETANSDLTAAFQAIAGGDEPKQPGNAASSQSSGTVTKADDESTDFPANMQRTWYGYSMDDDSEMITITFTGNKIISTDGTTTTIHSESERQPGDTYAAPGMIPSHSDWMTMEKGANGWVTVVPWFKRGPALQSYRVLLKNLDGSKVPVLVAGEGYADDVDVQVNFYPTAELADKWNTTYFTGEDE